MSARPDFVMVGGQSDGKFYLIASKTLTEVELRAEADELDWTPRRYDRTQPMRYRQFITAEMRDFVMIVGDSYAQCFADLFADWDPTPERPAIDGRHAIPHAPKAIEPGK